MPSIYNRESRESSASLSDLENFTPAAESFEYDATQLDEGEGGFWRESSISTICSDDGIFVGCEGTAKRSWAEYLARSPSPPRPQPWDEPPIVEQPPMIDNSHKARMRTIRESEKFLLGMAGGMDYTPEEILDFFERKPVIDGESMPLQEKDALDKAIMKRYEWEERTEVRRILIEAAKSCQMDISRIKTTKHHAFRYAKKLGYRDSEGWYQEELEQESLQLLSAMCPRVRALRNFKEQAAIVLSGIGRPEDKQNSHRQVWIKVTIEGEKRREMQVIDVLPLIRLLMKSQRL